MKEVGIPIAFGLTKIVFNKYCYCWKWGVWGVLKNKNFVENVSKKGRVN